MQLSSLCWFFQWLHGSEKENQYITQVRYCSGVDIRWSPSGFVCIQVSVKESAANKTHLPGCCANHSLLHKRCTLSLACCSRPPGRLLHMFHQNPADVNALLQLFNVLLFLYLPTITTQFANECTALLARSECMPTCILGPTLPSFLAPSLDAAPFSTIGMSVWYIESL